MKLLIEDFELPAYPSIQIPLNEYGRDILEIRATFFFDDNDQGHRVIKRVYWVIALRNHVFTQNRTWVIERSKKTDKFRDKIAFESIEDAIAFTKKYWKEISWL